MTDLEALFRAVLTDPDDDTLRLIYADALEEAGDARRAAFVRSEVALAGLPEYDPARVRARYVDRERIDPRWVTELPPLPDGLDWDREPFRRGLPAAVRADDAAAFVAGAGELFARFPVESLTLKHIRLTEARAFADCPWLARLVRLSVSEGLGGQSAAWMLDSPHYRRLRELHIGAGLTTASTAIAVVRSRVFKRLTALGCRSERSGGATLAAELVRLPDPPRLKSLDLSGTRLDAGHVAALLAAPVAAELEDLDLSDSNRGAEVVRVVAGASLPRLRSLHLLRARPEEDGVRALAGAEFLGGLRGLTLGGNNLPPAAAAVLAGAPGVSALRALDLRENRLGDVGASALAGSPHLKGLAHLDLAGNLIGDDGADALARSPHLAELTYLDLNGNPVSPPAAARLRRRFGNRVFL